MQNESVGTCNSVGLERSVWCFPTSLFMLTTETNLLKKPPQSCEPTRNTVQMGTGAITEAGSSGQLLDFVWGRELAGPQQVSVQP